MNLSPHSFYINPEADYSDLIEYYLAMGAKGVGEMCENLTWYDPLMDNIPKMPATPIPGTRNISDRIRIRPIIISVIISPIFY